MCIERVAPPSCSAAGVRTCPTHDAAENAALNSTLLYASTLDILTVEAVKAEREYPKTGLTFAAEKQFVQKCTDQGPQPLATAQQQHIDLQKSGSDARDARELCGAILQQLSDIDEDQEAPRGGRLAPSLQALLAGLEASGAGARAGWAAAVLEGELPVRLLASLRHLEFELHKEVACVLRALLASPGMEEQVAAYVRSRKAFFGCLIEGLGEPCIALPSAMVLRSCARHPLLVAVFLESGRGLDLLCYGDHEEFEVSSEALSLLRDFLLSHATASENCRIEVLKDAASFLRSNFRSFFELHRDLLRSDHYTTKRQALRLLSDLLAEGRFAGVMSHYVGQVASLKIVMELLLDESIAIQLEAMNVLMRFVTNPKIPPAVRGILCQNHARLLERLAFLDAVAPPDAAFDADAMCELLLSL